MTTTEHINACPVADLAQRAKCLTDAIRIADEAMNSKLLDRLTDRIDGINLYISHLQPQSLDGALYQISLIGHYAEWNDEEGKTEAKAAIERMTYAVADFLETMTPGDNRLYVGDFYLP